MSESRDSMPSTDTQPPEAVVDVRTDTPSRPSPDIVSGPSAALSGLDAEGALALPVAPVQQQTVVQGTWLATTISLGPIQPAAVSTPRRENARWD